MTTPTNDAGGTVAGAAYVLTGPDLARTTDRHIPFESGVRAALLR